MNVAPPVAEYPVAHDLVSQRERHDHQAQEEVGHGQASDEPVLYVLQRLLRGDGDDHQHVAHDDHDHQQCRQDGRQNDVRQRVPGWVQTLTEHDVRRFVAAGAVAREQETLVERVVERSTEILHHTAQAEQQFQLSESFHVFAIGGGDAETGTGTVPEANGSGRTTCLADIRDLHFVERRLANEERQSAALGHDVPGTEPGAGTVTGPPDRFHLSNVRVVRDAFSFVGGSLFDAVRSFLVGGSLGGSWTTIVVGGRGGRCGNQPAQLLLVVVVAAEGRRRRAVNRVGLVSGRRRATGWSRPRHVLVEDAGGRRSRTTGDVDGHNAAEERHHSHPRRRL